MFAEAVRQSSPCFAYVDFLAERAGYAIDDICGYAGEMVCDFDGSIGSLDCCELIQANSPVRIVEAVAHGPPQSC